MRSLSKQLNVFKKATYKRINLAKMNVARGILIRLGDTTPVDKTLALSNWIVNLRTARSNVIPAHFEGEHGNTQAQSANTMFQQGNAIIGNVKVGEKIFITNSVYYLYWLNRGSSPQADAGFIEDAVETALLRNDVI